MTNIIKYFLYILDYNFYNIYNVQGLHLKFSYLSNVKQPLTLL